MLLNLPNEILGLVLAHVEPVDLATLCFTCSHLRTHVAGNQLLYKQQYLSLFDPPPSDVDWELEVHNAVRLRKLLEASDDEQKLRALPFIHDTTTGLLSRAAPGLASRNASALASYFTVLDPRNAPPHHDRRIARCPLRSSSLFGRVLKEHPDSPYLATDQPNLSQLSAQLHCLFGIFGVRGDPRTEDLLLSHPYARARVYDLRYYTSGTMWGPFLENGSHGVDWENVEAIMIDLAWNMVRLSERTSTTAKPYCFSPFAGASPDSFVSAPPKLPKQLRTSVEMEDPYNVTGSWKRVVCFLDYSDLYAFNFTAGAMEEPQPRGPIDTEEAIRMIVMTLRATRIEPPGPEDGEELPVVHFTGHSKSIGTHWDPNANSRIRGTVRLTKHGEVRWTTVSVFFGEERWRSEGIQVGGVRSARGVWGTWFDKDYDPEGPAGPTAFWKMSDEVDPRLKKLDEEDTFEAQWLGVHFV